MYRQEQAIHLTVAEIYSSKESWYLWTCGSAAASRRADASACTCYISCCATKEINRGPTTLYQHWIRSDLIGPMLGMVGGRRGWTQLTCTTSCGPRRLLGSGLPSRTLMPLRIKSHPSSRSTVLESCVAPQAAIAAVAAGSLPDGVREPCEH